MIKVLYWVGLSLLIIWAINASGIFVAASLFLLAGIIPGTSWSLPPIPMLIVLAVLLIIVLYWIKKQRLAGQIKALKANHQTAQKPNNKRPSHHKATSRPRARYSQPKAATR